MLTSNKQTGDLRILPDQPGIKELNQVKQYGNYRALLRHFALDPVRVDFHWQVGRIRRLQGWLLHISIIRSQIIDVSQVIIPLLINYDVAFRIVQDYESAVDLLDGNLGREFVGKVFTIYPDSDDQALNLANELVSLTAPFRGPAVLTDIHLGGCVYTRYGGFNPVMRSDASGNIQKFIYDEHQNEVLDAKPIPFKMLQNVSWPFCSLAKPEVPSEKKILHNIYYPLSLLKSDPRGNVIKALYLTKYFFVKTCVIKQAKRDMWSDDSGRDMRDRLRWQYKLDKVISGIVSMPKFIALFEKDDDLYGAMEYVKGPSVFEYIAKKLNSNCDWFQDWPKRKQIVAINFLLRICNVVEKLCETGVVHRDITPVNFIVGRSKRLILIDNELAYSMIENQPFPPFNFGTPGFMSPEQEEVKIPTQKEDIYGLGATIIAVLIGIPPITFDTQSSDKLENNLVQFIQDHDVACLIAACLSFYPESRPALHRVKERLEQYKGRLLNEKSKSPQVKTNQGEDGLNEIIQGAVKGLVTATMMIHKGLWQTRKKNTEHSSERPNHGFAKSGGFYEGISGILYTIAEAKLAGFDVTDCKPIFLANYDFLKERYLSELPHLPPGLSGGAAGMAMAIAQGMTAGLIETNMVNKRLLQTCFEVMPAGIDVAEGAAGQGMAALKSAGHLELDFLTDLLVKYVNMLLEVQDKQGNWLTLKIGNKKPETAILFNQGNTGINLFLMECYTFLQQHESKIAETLLKKAIFSSLDSFRRIHKSIKKRYQQCGYRGHLVDVQLGDGFKGLILNYLKAFELSHDSVYLDLATDLLLCYPNHLLHEDLSLQHGMVGLGLIYVEAFKVSNNNIWKTRANWIKRVIENTTYRGMTGNYYWLSNNQTLPTADYMVGNAGIIHFLLEYQKVI